MSKAKIIAKKSVKAALMERKILTRLMEAGTGGVADMLASFQDNDNLYILMDYLPGQSLRHHLNCGSNFTEGQISKIFPQLRNHNLCHSESTITTLTT